MIHPFYYPFFIPETSKKPSFKCLFMDGLFNGKFNNFYLIQPKHKISYPFPSNFSNKTFCNPPKLPYICHINTKHPDS